MLAIDLIVQCNSVMQTYTVVIFTAKLANFTMQNSCEH